LVPLRWQSSALPALFIGQRFFSFKKASGAGATCGASYEFNSKIRKPLSKGHAGQPG